MDQDSFEEFNRLYSQLMGHLVTAVEEAVSSLMQGIPLESPGPLTRMLGTLAIPQNAPLEACYRMLGLEPTASWDEVQRRYREMARRLHPDMAGAETAHLFRMVTAAYEQIQKARREPPCPGGL